jgi:organic radical activating enzyme
MGLVKRNMYRLPWSMNDNPIGWLETTDKCNMYCLGCYRKEIAGHKPLEELKEDIDFFAEWRNCYNISIAGGEPLLHPDIVEIVDYINRKGMKPLILSNGKALTRELLVDLKKVGLLGVAFNIHSNQKREPKWNGKTEAELNELRSELNELVASVDGMYCNFGMTVYRSNIDQINDVIRWGNENIETVHGMVFITFRAAPLDMDYEYVDATGQKVDASELSYAFDKSVHEDAGLTSQDVWAKVREEFPHYDACSYLGGSQYHASIKWLIGVQIGMKGRMLGAIGPRTMELAQVWHHFFKGTYLTYRRSNKAPRSLFLLGSVDEKVRAARRAFWKYVVQKPLMLFSPVYLQSIGIIQAPDILEDGRADMCDSCPDMTVWDGKLVHSCRMDEWRLFGSYISQYVDDTKDLPEEIREEIERLLEQAR